jgi:streptogramin lyase
MLRRSILLPLVTLVLPLAEPAPRRPQQISLKINVPLTGVTAARELPDGRVLLTDAAAPAVLLLDPHSGQVTALGSIGPGPQQYVKPGGLYGGPAGTTLLLDRGQTRVMTISAEGQFTGTSSIAEHGSSSSSDSVDLYRVDGRGFAYFLDNLFGRVTPGSTRREATIIRFEPVAQKREPVTSVRLAEMRTVKNGNMTFGPVK